MTDRLEAPLLRSLRDGFVVTVEVVTPAGPDPDLLLEKLAALRGLPFFGYSVATNPVATPRMSALTFCSLLRQRLRRPAILHCTTRDHNRLALQSLLWGARAAGIDTVLAATGDLVAHRDRATTTTVRDADVYALLRMIEATGLTPGAVMTPRENPDELERELRRLGSKIRAGARYVVTQPLFTEKSARELASALEPLDVPVLLGILPIRTPRHGRFLQDRVSGISVPPRVQERIEQSRDPAREGVLLAGEMLEAARELFSGACIMPPFGHYEIIASLFAGAPSSLDGRNSG